MDFKWMIALILLCACGSPMAFAVPVTILHTNDLHSHFRPEKTPLALGGVARLKTAVDRLRKKVPNTVLVDAGDWSEGNIYYTQGAGRDVLRMLDGIGYDVALIGNHDWLNGPDTLLDAIEQAHPKVSILGSNFDTSAYPRQKEFRENVLPYVIKDVGGVKIAFIGMATYEFIYDQFIAPIKMIEPFRMTRELARKLRKVADAVIVISHNRLMYNEGILEAAPEVDLVIGAHDHVKLTEPLIVKRPGHADGWIVETGCWGRYLGRVDLDITPRSSLDDSGQSHADPVKLLNYRLTQMDKTIPENPHILAQVEQLEKHIENRMGPIFHDHVGDSEVELMREGPESLMGDLLTDAYRKATGAKLALDEKHFVYGNLHEGKITSADIFNANPAVYDPRAQRAWTLKTAPMKGSTVSLIFKLLLSKAGPFSNAIYMSGASTYYQPDPASTSTDPNDSALSNQSRLFGSLIPWDPDSTLGPVDPSTIHVLIDGEPIRPDETYWVAAGGGIFETIDFINSVIPNLIPTAGVRDTGLESWRILGDYVHSISPVTLDKLGIENRVQTPKPNLRIFYNDVNWTPLRRVGGKVVAKIRIRVKNYGLSSSTPAEHQLILSTNLNGNDYARTPQFHPVGEAIDIPSLAPGESLTFERTMTLRADRGAYSVVVKLLHGAENAFPEEHGHSNASKTSDEVIRYFSAAQF
jgi:5'-nucleotidase